MIPLGFHTEQSFATSNVGRLPTFSKPPTIAFTNRPLNTHNYPNVEGAFLSLDGSRVKSVFGHDGVVRNPTDLGRNGSKISAIVHEQGLPVALHFHQANTSDIALAIPTLDRLNHVATPRENSRKRAIYLLAHKGYYSRAFLAVCRQRGCNPGDSIPNMC